MSDYIFAALLPKKNNMGCAKDLEYCTIKMLKMLKIIRSLESLENYKNDIIKISISCNTVGGYKLAIIIKIHNLNSLKNLTLRDTILIKFYQFCIMAISRVSSTYKIVLNIDIIKYILSFIDFSNMIAPLNGGRYNTISLPLLRNIIIVLLGQDIQNELLNTIIQNLSHIGKICPILY